MTKYILINQHGEILDKHLLWLKDYTTDGVFSSEHKDVALNQLIELNSADIAVRARLIECQTTDKGRVIFPEDTTAVTQPSPQSSQHLA